MNRTGAPHPPSLPRKLGVLSGIAVLVGSTIGSGIFRVPSTVAAQVGSPVLVLLLWAVGAALALAGALTLAELAVLFPRSGGVYVFIRESFGPLPAFLFGWTQLVVIRPSAIGAISVIFASYVGAFLPISEGEVRFLAAGAILVVAGVNFRSVTWGAALENVTTLAKVFALTFVVVLAVILVKDPNGIFTPAAPGTLEPGFGSIALALVAILWAYDGWADLTFMGDEVRDPGRTFPRALIAGVLVVVALYLLVNISYLHVLSLEEMAASELVAADAAVRIAGAGGEAVVAALVLVSTFGALNGAMMTGPRIFFAMAEDGLFFQPVARVHSVYRTPWVAILLAAGLGVAYVSIRSFEQLADTFILGIWPFYVLAVAGVYVLRYKHPEMERSYRVPGYPILPAVFLLASLAMLAAAFASEPAMALLDAGVIFVGVPAYLLAKRHSGRRFNGPSVPPSEA